MSRMSAALALSVLVSTGCSGGSDTPPSTLPTLSSTPSPTPTVEPVPSAATAETPDGADAFVRYFFAQMNIAFREARPELITALAQPTCRTCKRLADSLEKSRLKGELLNGDTFTVQATAATAVSASRGTVTVAGDLPARDATDSTGRVTRKIAAQGHFAFDVNIVWTLDRWLVDQMSEVS